MSDEPIRVDYDALSSLRSLLGARGDDFRAAGAALRGVPALVNADVSAGQHAVERLWGQAFAALGESLDLTATRVGTGLTVYQQGDRAVAAGFPAPVQCPTRAAV